MSKVKKALFPLLFLLLVQLAAPVSGQPARLEVVIRLEQRVWKIRLTCVGTPDCARSDLTFINSYADAERLSNRILKISAFDSSGKIIELRPLGEGVYSPASSYSRLEYEVDASAPTPLIAAPHVSWAASDYALIKLFDLLPGTPPLPVKILFELPRAWTIHTREKRTANMLFETADPENAVFLAGKDVRQEIRSINGTELLFAIHGKWQFEDSVLPEMASEILTEYRKIFGSFPRERFQINLLSFPGSIENDRWRAETQGGTVSIVSSSSTYRNLAQQRLHEQLRHELFHFWIPGGLKLIGDYAWFYEGFARYQSLKTGVWVGRITFDDFLRSMSESINIASFDSSGLPLDKLSRSMWISGPGTVAAKGMALAFLCDLKILAASRGKKSSADILRNLYVDHGGEKGNEASVAIEAGFARFDELAGISGRFVKGTDTILWPAVLRPFGLSAEIRNGRTVLLVDPKPKGEAKALLRRLGYTRWKIYSPNK